MKPISGQSDRATERERMVVEQLVRRGIRSESVLSAMREVPRETFVSNAADAYADAALAIDCDQTISQPYMVARMTELLALTPSDHVLEVGTGTGYQTAILARLAQRVFTIEWHLRLMTQAAERLERLEIQNVTYRCADGSLGWAERSPFDAILVTAGAPEAPQPLGEQLKLGGRLVVPVGNRHEQRLVLVRHTPSGLEQGESVHCRFVKLLGAAGWTD